MALAWLPKAGSMTEGNVARMFAGMLSQEGLYHSAALGGKKDTYTFLGSSGLAVFLNDYLSEWPVSVLHGYAVSVASDSDLTVTLPANSKSYVYLVLDMAGGGTNTISQRLVYYPTATYVPYGLLIASALTNATSVVSITYLCNTRQTNVQYHPETYSADAYGYSSMILQANTERSTQSTTEVLAKQFTVEFSGVIDFDVDIKRTTTGTGTISIYCASTGDTAGVSTPQYTTTTTSSSYAEKTGFLYVVQGDTVSVYHKISSASGTMFTDNCRLRARIGTPIAPAFLIE